MGGGRPDEPVGRRPRRPGDAGRGRRRRRRPRRAAGRRADDNLHRLAGPPPDDPQHVQDCGRAYALRLPCCLALHRHPGLVDLRRPFRRHGGACDWFRFAQRGIGARGARSRAGGAGGDFGGAGAVRPFHGRVPHLARVEYDRDAVGRADPRHDRRRSRPRPPPAWPESRTARHPRHGPEPRHLLPGAGDGKSVLPVNARHRAADDGSFYRPDRPPLPPVSLRRSPGGRARGGRNGLGRRNIAGDGRLSQRAG